MEETVHNWECKQVDKQVCRKEPHDDCKVVNVMFFTPSYFSTLFQGLAKLIASLLVLQSVITNNSADVTRIISNCK